MESDLMDAEGQARRLRPNTTSKRTGDLRSVRSQGTQTEPLVEEEGGKETLLKSGKRKKYGRRSRKRGRSSGAQELRLGASVYQVACRQVKDQGNDSTANTPEPEPWVIPDSARELRRKQLEDPDIAPIINNNNNNNLFFSCVYKFHDK